MRWSRFFLWAIPAAIVLMAAAFVAPYFYPIRMLRSEMVLGYGTMVMLYLVVGLCCSVPLESGRAPRLMSSGIILGAASLAGWAVGLAIASNSRNGISDVFFKVIVWPTTWACLMAIIGLLLLIKKGSGWRRILRISSMAPLILLAADICLAVTFYPDDDRSLRYAYEDAAFRIGSVLAMLAGAAIVMTFLAAWLGFGQPQSAAVIGSLPYWFRCPRCADEQASITGACSCRRCGLKIRVEMS